MGQSSSTVSRTASSKPRSAAAKPTATMAPAIADGRDHSSDLPDDCLALILQLLGSRDRKRCSLVCRRWLHVDGQSRHRLSLDAARPSPPPRPRSSTASAPSRSSLSSATAAPTALATTRSRSSPGAPTSRLKLRACREITEAGMAALARNCAGLKKLSCGSCAFGAKGIDAVLKGCPLMEEISIKRLRGLTDASGEQIGPGAAATSLRSVCLKELYNGQCFGPLIAGSPNLKTLKLFRCSGDWDRLLEEMAKKVPGIVEIHLEKLQVTDRGLHGLPRASTSRFSTWSRPGVYRHRTGCRRGEVQASEEDPYRRLEDQPDRRRGADGGGETVP
ncbi:F-box protein-like [Iris pallida]|uniref:F-box protein-like n=1 Tax=Iris pallida TaxID=29817 RepID=A0AAX6E934_IRIPA|nr:F-box protein-like [Iris pallida]